MGKNLQQLCVALATMCFRILVWKLKLSAQWEVRNGVRGCWENMAVSVNLVEVVTMAI